MARLFCFGLGYTARHLAAHLRRQGWQIAGTCRSPQDAERLRAEGIAAHAFSRARPLAEPAAALEGATHLLSSVPPDERGDPVLDCHGGDIAACAPGIVWAGYLSATGIYGDRGGAWVDEETEPRPTTERGRRRLMAEQGWCALWRAHGLPVHLFRLAGIYGPGRSPLEAVRAGRARRVVKPGQVFSRIHVADIVATLMASMARPHPGRAYNVCDDLPAPPQEVIAFAAALLGLAPPPEITFAEAELSPMAQSFYADNKRVSNARLKRELGLTLAFPTYREGLAALATEDA